MPVLVAVTDLPWPWIVVLGVGVSALVFAGIIQFAPRKLSFIVGSLVESDTPKYGLHTWTFRLTLSANREHGLVSAHLLAADGFPMLMAPLPLGWSNHDPEYIELGPALPVSVFCGFLDVPREAEDFTYLPLGPGFPVRHAYSSIRSVGSQLTLRIRIIDKAKRRHRDISLPVSVKAGVPSCSPQLLS